MDFDENFFLKMGRSHEVTKLCRDKAEEIAAAARASAPRDTEDYANGIEVRIVERARRNAAVVFSKDPKTMLIESVTGNLVRALKKVKKSG